jgi:NAD/NADP transhydrogenase beta subunit
MNVFTALILRFIAFALVTYAGVSLEWAVMLTSDPELVGLLNATIGAGVVVVTEELSKRVGPGLSKLLLSLATKYAAKQSEKLILHKPD